MKATAADDHEEQTEGSLVSRVMRSWVARQAAAFTGASALASVLSLVAVAFVARRLSADDFGAFSFAVALLGFVAMFFEFGVYSASARFAATSPADRRAIVGAALIIYAPIGVAFSLVMVASTPLVERWFERDLGGALVLAAVLGVAYPFTYAGQLLAQGVDRLHVSSVGAAVFPVSFLALLGLLEVTGVGTSVGSALAARSVALAVAGVLVAVWLRPVLHRTRAVAGRIIREVRDYGFHVYVGRLLSVGTYNMDVLLVGVWAPVEDVGFYALAVAISGAAGLPVIALSTALFARMATAKEIDRTWLWLSVVGGGALALAAFAIAGPFIDLVFSSRYRAVLPLLAPLLAAQVVRGTTSVYNVYLASHGRGRELRNAGLVLTVSNLVLNFALIPPYGAAGAAWASLGALVANYWAHVVFYRRARRNAVA